MLYFGYGSNLDEAQMQERCPQAIKVGTAVLANHRLTFPRTSKKRKCGVSSVDPAEGHEVWGVVYELTSNDAARLDASEGYQAGRPASDNRYNRQKIVVKLGGVATEVETYVAVAEENPPLPSKNYVGLILGGAAAHGFADSYRALLKAIVTAD